jgi:hypothetical protein
LTGWREFAGADQVLVVKLGSGESAVLGFSSTGAALCATDGKGPHACIVRWLHEGTAVIETRFDLLKDSLPVLGHQTLALDRLRLHRGVRIASRAVPAPARAVVTLALRPLGAG